MRISNLSLDLNLHLKLESCVDSNLVLLLNRHQLVSKSFENFQKALTFFGHINWNQSNACFYFIIGIENSDNCDRSNWIIIFGIRNLIKE